MAAENQDNPRGRRCRKILLLCILLLLCGIGAEGMLLLRRAENGIQTVQHDPAAELLNAVRSGDYEAARILRMTDYPDGSVPDEITAELTAQAQQIRDEYFAGQTDAESAKEKLRTLMKLGIPALDDAAKPLSEEIRVYEGRLQMIRHADAAYDAGDYAAALKLYRMLPANETALQQQIAQRYEDCSQRMNARAENEAAAAAKAHDYDAAYQVLDETAKLYGGESAFLEGLREEIKEQQQKYDYLEACRKARICFDSGDYTGAFQALETPESIMKEMLRSDVTPLSNPYLRMFSDSLQSFSDAYFRSRSAELRTLLQEGDLSRAEEIVAEAETLFPDVPESAAFRAQLQTAAPQELIAFGTPELSDCRQTADALTGADGRTYQSESGNLYCTYEGTLSGRQSSSAVFQIGGGFRRLTLTAVPLESFAEGQTVLLEVGTGESVLETYAVTKKTGALHIDLDITGAESLRLRVRPSGVGADLRNAGVILADAKVQP